MGRSRQGAEFFVTESHLGQEDAIDRLRVRVLPKSK